MPVKKSVSFIRLSILYLLAIALREMASAGQIDLNSLPDSNTEDSNEPEKIKPLSPVPTPTKREIQITDEFYVKVLRLFDVLKVCDNKNFDITKQKIPDNFSAQNKAIMALNTIASNKLIKDEDKGRYRRIRKNCLALAKAYRDKQELLMSVDSQTSGGTYEDRLKRLKQSPLEGMKDRFIDDIKKNEIANRRAASKFVSRVKTVKEKPSASIEFEQLTILPDEKPTEFFQFL